MTSPRELPTQALLQAFPFHLWVDEALDVMQFGPALASAIPELRANAPLLEPLKLDQTLGDTIDAASLRSLGNIGLTVARTGVRLCGRVVALDDGSTLCLLEPAEPHDLLVEELRAKLDDIEQQRRVLAERHHRVTSHVHHMPLAIIDWDTQGRIVGWNPAAAKIFGISAAQAIGHGTELLGIIGPIEEADRGGPEFDLFGAHNHRVVVEHTIGSGAKVLCAWHNTPLVDVDGNAIGVSSILRDVTESVRVEQAKRESLALDSLGRLAGGIAHDFNNLLAAMLGNADLALLETEPGSTTARYLREITALAERATSLTKQLLDSSGRATYELEPLSLAELVEQMRPLLSSLTNGVRLEIETVAELPTISADSGQLRRVITGLVINATEAIEQRGGEVRITTSVLTLRDHLDDPELRGGPLEPGTYVRIEVVDNGAGISPEQLPHIFDPFFSTKFAGRGLGLASVLGIVRGHRGVLRVESELGVGTRFELLFPALEHPASRLAVVAHERTGKGRVLVVDDEDQVRRVLTTALASAGFEVVAAEAGNTALELYDNDPEGFDLVLTDLTMPGLDGHELFRALTSRDPRLPVILSSGYSESQVVSRYPDGRPATFLKKPFRLGYLLTKVSEELGKRAS